MLHTIVPTSRRPRGLNTSGFSLLLVATLVIGCNGSSEVDEQLNPAVVPLVPVSGVITSQGKPLKGAVVTFMPTSGAASNGETDDDGKYELSTYSRKGALIGTMKVAISYLASKEGEPQGIGPRSAMAQSAAMLSSTERLPPEYADLGRTKLSATVGAQGGTFNFDVPAISGPGVGVGSADPASAPAPAPAADSKTAQPPESPTKTEKAADTPQPKAAP